MVPGDITYTSEGFWTSALIVAVVDVALVVVLARRTQAADFRRLKWRLVAASAVFWGILAIVLTWGYWDNYYRYFEPASARILAPAAATVVYAAIGLALWWMALHLPGHPALNFCLLGGLESLVEHAAAIYIFGILGKVPGFAGVSPVSVLAFAMPEYVLYWGIALSAAFLLDRGWPWWKRR